MRRSRTLLAVLTAYAMALQSMLTAGLAASQPLQPAGMHILCAPDARIVRRDAAETGSAATRGTPPDVLHAACCCMAVAGGPPATPVPPADISIQRPDTPLVVAFVSGATAHVWSVAPRPAARPRAPPAV